MRVAPLVAAIWAAISVIAFAEAEPSRVLASVGGVEITAADLEREMLRQSGRRPDAFVSAEQRRALLDEMIRERMVVVAAREAGYADDPEIVAASERMMATKFRQERLDEAQRDLEPSDEDVLAWYEEHEELYSIPGRVQAAIIRLDLPAGASDEQQGASRRRAEEVVVEARALPHDVPGFGPLAMEYSDDRASRYIGGVIGWLSEGREYRWPTAVVEAAFALTDDGDVSGIIETDKAMWIVRLVERRERQLRPLADVEAGIRHELERASRHRQRQKFYRSLAASIAVQVNDAALDSVTAPVIDDPRNSPPPSMSSNDDTPSDNPRKESGS